MSRAIGTLCMLIVCLQILIGVPIVVCIGFLCLTNGIGPVAIEVHTGHDHSGLVTPPAYSAPSAGPIAMALPPNVIPHSAMAPLDNPVLATRADHGSPLAGTVLSEKVSPEAEQQLFIAAFEKVAAEQASCSHTSSGASSAATTNGEETTEVAAVKSEVCCAADKSHVREQTARSAIQHLYEMAEADERAGEYARADQWRALAREIKSSGEGVETAAIPAGDSSSASLSPPHLDR